jgi:hypothetical protein
VTTHALQVCLTLRLGTRMLTSSPLSLKHGSMHQLLLRDGATAGYFATVSIELRQQTGIIYTIHALLQCNSFRCHCCHGLTRLDVISGK